jgi:hypothetical protein
MYLAGFFQMKSRSEVLYMSDNRYKELTSQIETELKRPLEKNEAEFIHWLVEMESMNLVVREESEKYR